MRQYTLNNQKFPSNNEAGLVEVLRWREINPNVYETIDLKKQEFFKCPVVSYSGKLITVLEVLKFYAYVRGGIHLDKGQKEYEPLREVFDIIKINQLPMLDHSMRGIVQVIYTALKSHKELLLY